jgi:speckle-type POZ protein
MLTVTHDFEVTNYRQLDGLGVGKYVSSSTFSVAGCDWNIRFYPDGSNSKENGDGNASAFLYHLSPAKDVRTQFTLNILEKHGEIKVTNYDEIMRIFSPSSYNWGYPDFVKKSKLKSSLGINNGYFTIRCVLTIIKEPRTEVKRTLLEVPGPNLQDHLVQMLKDGKGADVTFNVCGQLFHAHRCLLAARSPVFMAELFGPMKEKTTQHIKIDDIEPPIFEELLHFVYTDSMLDDEQYKEGRTAKLQHLLVAADRYGLDKLRVLCERKLCESMDVETIATTLALAEQHHCTDLKEACVEFMAPWNVLQAVMATDGFNHLVESCPLVMKELLEMVARGG